MQDDAAHQDVTTTVRGDGIIEVLFDRPAKLNALSLEMITALSEAADELARRADLRLLLIRSKGRYFSAGSDFVGGGIPEFNGSTMAARHWYRGGVDRASLSSIADRLETVEKPVVVAHHGPCLGGALEMSLSCDFRLAAKSAHYGLPEIDLGALPGSGGASRMTRICGPHWARWLVMAGQKVDADIALIMGLVHAVWPDDEFDARVEAFCQGLLARPAEAMGLCKLSIEMMTDLDRTQGRGMERLANSILFQGNDIRDRMSTFSSRGKGAQQQIETLHGAPPRQG